MKAQLHDAPTWHDRALPDVPPRGTAPIDRSCEGCSYGFREQLRWPGETYVTEDSAMRLVSDEVLPPIAELRSHGMLIGIATDTMDCFTRWTVPSLR